VKLDLAVVGLTEHAVERDELIEGVHVEGPGRARLTRAARGRLRRDAAGSEVGSLPAAPHKTPACPHPWPA
jgi:hypothetical protein